MVTDDSETYRLDNLESEVVGGACGAPDRKRITVALHHRETHTSTQ